MVLRNVDQQISDSRQRLGDRWLRKIIASGLEWLKLTQAIADDTDDILNFFARRDGTSPLHLAALTGNARLIQYLLGHDSVDIESKNAHGETPLHYASISRSTPAIQILCERGASVNAQTQLHATPIHYAVLAFVPSDALQCLSVHEADLNISSDSMDSLQETIFSDYYFRLTGTPLAWATAIENLDAADTLLEYGSDPFSGDVQSSECPSWQLAFSNRSLDIIQLLFSRSKAVERPFIKFDEIVPHLGQESTTPLRLIVHGSMARNHFVRQVLNLLVSLGAEVDEMGVVCQLLDVQLFPEATVDIVEDIISRKGLQPTTDFGVYRLRSFNSDNIFICPLTLDTFLASALTGGSVEMVRMLFKRIGNLKTTIVPQIQYLETDPPQPDVHRTYFELLADTPFRSEHEMADLVECLLAHGADRSAKGSAPLREKQCCPLRYAVYAHRFAAVKTFLDYGIGDAFGALARALEDSNSLLSLPIVTLILDKRPEVLLEDIPIDSGLEYTYTIPGIGMPAGEEPPVGLTAFMSILCNLNELDRNDAITEKKLLRIRKAVEELPVGRVAMRKVVCTPDFLGSTLLHYAARNANMPLCEMLLDMGADVNATEDILGFNTMFPDLSDLAAMTQQLNVALAEGQSVSSTLESTSLDTIGMQSAAMPLTAVNTNAPFSLLKGPTPLDQALQREWSTSLRSQAFFQDEVNKLHNLAGDHKQRKDFCRRTDEVVQYLRGKGGKTSSEIREIFQNDF
jgi:ankyrin repeat protein